MNDVVGLVLFTAALGGMVLLALLTWGFMLADVFITDRHGGLSKWRNSWLEGELGMGSRWPDECRRGRCGCSTTERPGAAIANRLRAKLDAEETAR